MNLIYKFIVDKTYYAYALNKSLYRMMCLPRDAIVDISDVVVSMVDISPERAVAVGVINK